MQAPIDLLVLGGGSGGVRAARRAAERGLKVAIIEKEYWGGTCVNAGCVPKKLLVTASEFGDVTLANSYGWETQPSLNWPLLRDRVLAKTRQLAGLYKKRLRDLEVDTIEAEGRFLSAAEVQAGKEIYRPRTILVATGSKAFVPSIPGRELALTSDDMFHLEELPRSIVIVGGGYIALEFACMLSSFGCEVFLVYRAERPLRHFDAELSTFVADQLSPKIQQLPRTNILSVSRDEKEGIRVRLASRSKSDGSDKGQQEQEIRAQSILFATGRIANTESVTPREAGIALTPTGSICVDENFKTSVPHIFALGDVTDTLRLTPVAIAEAEVFVRQRFGKEKISAAGIPALTASAVFCKPEVATLGMSFEQAAEKYGKKSVGCVVKNITSLKYSLMKQAIRSFIKLVYHKKDETVLGIHIAGEHASEIMQGFAVANSKGLKLEDLRKTIAIHPTLAEELVTSI